jgi:gas vesicle GvpC-like protein
MKITKQQKTLLGVGVVAVAAYLIWKQTQVKKEFTRGSFIRGRRGQVPTTQARFAQRRMPTTADALALEVNEFLSGTAKQRQEQARLQAQELLDFRRKIQGDVLGQLNTDAKARCGAGGTFLGNVKGYDIYSSNTGEQSFGCDANGNRYSYSQLKLAGVVS